MGIAIFAIGETSQDLYFTLQQQSESGALGDIWDNTNGLWASAPSNANRKVVMTQGVGINAGTFTGGTGQLGTYSGIVVMRIHDASQADLGVGGTQLRLSNGNQVYQATTADIAGLPLATWFTINSQGGVLSSNMRGTENAMLASSYVAPNNALLTTAAADALAAKVAAQAAQTNSFNASLTAASADGKLPADTTTKLGRLDVAVSSRSSHTAADIRADINGNGGVLSSNMRGTENAMLASSYVAPNNAAIVTAAADAAAAKAASETTVARLTAPRAGYLDNLSAGPVATQTTVASISNSVRAKVVAPVLAELPASGSTVFTLDVLLYDTAGAMEDADANPTFTAANASGTDRSGNLGSVTKLGTGQYRTTYTVASAASTEQIIIKANIVEAGQTLVAIATFPIVPAGGTGGGGGGFLTADRAKLDAIHAKLPSKSFLAGTALSDGDIDLAEMVGDRSPFKADVSGLATSAALTALQSHGNATWSTATGFLTSTDIRLDRLDVNVSSRSTFNPGGIVAMQSDITALQSHGDANWDTATGFLATNDARLNNLDAPISTRSTFNAATTGVTLSAGHGLATAATQTLIKAKTDLLPSQPAAMSDIPSAATNAAQVAATLATTHGAGSWEASGGDATLAKQNQILAQLASITPTPSSPNTIDDSRTWLLKQTGEGAVAGNLVTITTDEVVDLAMEFRRKLNQDSTISLVSDVTVIEGDVLTVTDKLPSGNRTAAHFKVSTATAGLRRIQVKITTSDGQVLTGRGFLEVV